MLDFEVLPNGDLKISLDSDGKEYLEENFKNMPYDDLWCDLLEPTMCNGSYQSVRPEWIGALTSSPIITNDLWTNEDGDFEGLDKVWWFPDYMVRDEFKELLKKGYVLFTKAPENKAA